MSARLARAFACPCILPCYSSGCYTRGMQRLTVDSYVIDALMPDLVQHDRRPSAFLVYLYLWRRSAGASRNAVASYRMLADGTGLSKRAVQDAVRVLARRQLV